MEAAAVSTKDMLLTAQQKLDEINRENLGLSSNTNTLGSFGRGSTTRRRKGIISNQLLSTLLYFTLLSYKVEDIKTILEEEDVETYDEWRCLFETIHSPHFHAQERIIQNQRVKRTFSRKHRYKAEAERLREELTNASTELSKLQLLSNETSNQMIKAINKLHEERAALVSVGGDKQRQIEELNKQCNELRLENVRKDAMLQSKESELVNSSEMLKVRNQYIAALEEQLSRCKHDAAVAKEVASHSQLTLDDVHAQLETSNGRLADYQVATESTLRKLQHELMEAQSSNAVLSAKLEATNKLLDSTKQHFDESKEIISEKSATYDEIKNHLDDVKELLQRGMSHVSNVVSDKAVSLELRVDQVHGTLQKSVTDVKEAFGGYFERENNNALKELLALRHQMKDLRQLHQVNTLREEVCNVQNRLDDILCELRQCYTSQQQRRSERMTCDIQAGDLVQHLISLSIYRLGGARVHSATGGG
ncbi:hypothetical protein ACHAWU_005642 [Discostella pseudostelligera]|uniref:Uncharacterized protein n=1 Tax=Discostella pseudostelligera TaxID=259834 RepID=A0ABD3LWK2_9STRA